MARTTDARDRALAAAERLFRTQGYAATGLAQILEESAAPKGSFYHHFPCGKAQMAEEALAAYALRGEALIAHLATRPDTEPETFVRSLSNAFALEMQRSGWTLGCMAQNLAGELAPQDDVWTARLADVFLRWTAAISDALVACGLDKTRADPLAAAFLAALEGARTLARIARCEAPFQHVAEAFVAAVKAS